MFHPLAKKSDLHHIAKKKLNVVLNMSTLVCRNNVYILKTSFLKETSQVQVFALMQCLMGCQNPCAWIQYGCFVNQVSTVLSEVPSNTERSKKFRKDIRSDPVKHEEYKKKDRDRKKKKYIYADCKLGTNCRLTTKYRLQTADKVQNTDSEQKLFFHL